MRLGIRSTLAVALGALIAAVSPVARQSAAIAQPTTAVAPAIGANDIAGVVTSRFGPEAGVWVIAAAKDFGTRYAKIVVTDDSGRFVIPDLPKARYDVWVRGYGLVDSPKTETAPGNTLSLQAVVAPARAAAAQYYPAIYWFSLLKVPEESRFPGTGPNGNGIPPFFKTQAQWLDLVKTNGCVTCHQLGNYATRTIPPALGHFDSSIEAWARRLQSGPADTIMSILMGGMLGPDGGHLAALADWTDRIAHGEIPSAAPPRPVGLERNLVLTEWDWLSPKSYIHDLIATDKRNPAVNANGLLFGTTEVSTDDIPTLDPVHNAKGLIHVPVRDPQTPSFAMVSPVNRPSPYFGMEQTWNSHTNVHSAAMDSKGRIFFAAQMRSPNDQPSYCGPNSPLRSAQLYPLDAKPNGLAEIQNSRQVTVYDPTTQKFSFIDTCFGTHHVAFAEDAHNTLWFSNNSMGKRAVVGWIDTEKFLETGDGAASQGWTPFIVDTNGNDKRDEGYNEPGQPVDPNKDTRVPYGIYGIAWNPVDGSIWGSSTPFPGYILRIDPGPNPPDTALTEIYRVPMPGYGIRGMDIDRNGVVWVPLDSGHIASFDRRKCKGPLNGPGAEQGNKCPEGWTFYPLPGPPLQGDSESAESPYYLWVDQHNVLGLGANTPIATGNESDSLHALVDGHIVELRVPYPMGFFAKAIDGRIDDPDAGWKGRGLWVGSGNRTPVHIEGIDAPVPGAPGATAAMLSSPLVVRFQLRPNPLAH